MIEVLKQMVEALEWCHGGEPVGTADAIQAGLKAIADLESQEPVAWMYDWTTSEGEFLQNWTTSEAETLRDTEPTIITNVRPLYATPQPCPTCEALARTVMMDQTGRDL